MQTRSLTESSPLTRREIQILQLVSDGLNTSEIAARLYRSEFTISNHMRSILFKLQATTRAQAVAVALRTGLL